MGWEKFFSVLGYTKKTEGTKYTNYFIDQTKLGTWRSFNEFWECWNGVNVYTHDKNRDDVERL